MISKFNEKNKEIARNVDINEYLLNRGIVKDSEGGGKTKYSSPFANDSDPSFVVYNNTNSFYCFSTGIGGDIIALVMELEGINFPLAIKSLLGGEHDQFIKSEYEPKTSSNFYLRDYLARNPRVIREVRLYARSRSIYGGYECCQIRKFVNDEWVVIPALGFVHVDENLKPCGVKLRNVTGSGDSRFKAGGRQQFYVLENLIEDSFAPEVLYIVESESSANSLWQHAKDNKINCVVISFGSVTAIPKDLPHKYRSIRYRHIIIDYDGSEELFNERIKMYKGLNGTFIKLRLEKGEDLNSMYTNGTIKLLKLW